MDEATGGATDRFPIPESRTRKLGEPARWYEQPTKSIGAVVGENVKLLREERGLTQHELCQVWKRCGLKWARSKLAALENGARNRVDLGEFPMMATGLGVRMDELFAGEGIVRVDPGFALLTRESMRRLFSGGPPDEVYGLDVPGARGNAWLRAHGALDMPVEADTELAKRLGVTPGLVIEAAMRLFDGRTLTAERDRRVERMGDLSAPERPAHRGHVTRELSQQIEQELSEASRSEGK